jgi:Spy/CpxP family protein refolding chaperone
MKATLLLLLLALPLAAQQPDNNDPIGRYLIPPELVMKESERIGLTDKQRVSIKSEVQKTQAKFLDAQWDLQEATAKMSTLLQQTPVDETKVLEHADRIMALEREMKRAQLTLLIRIRNLLTAEQVAKLSVLQRGLHQ